MTGSEAANADRLKEDLWTCTHIMHTALNERRLIGRQQSQQLKLAPSSIKLSLQLATHQSYDAIMLLHFLPKVLEARNQAVVQRLQLLRRLLPMDANPICQDGDLKAGRRALKNDETLSAPRPTRVERVERGLPAGR